MNQSKPQCYQIKNRGVPWRPNQYRSVAWLARALLSILGVTWLTLAEVTAKMEMRVRALSAW
jgi:hypothetical protein